MPEEESLGQRWIREHEERVKRRRGRLIRRERHRRRTARENKRAEGPGTMERDSISERLKTLSRSDASGIRCGLLFVRHTVVGLCVRQRFDLICAQRSEFVEDRLW